MNNKDHLYNLLFQGILNHMSFSDLLRQVSRDYELEIYFCDPLGRVQIGDSTDKLYYYFLNNSQNGNSPLFRTTSSHWVSENVIDARKYYIRNTSGKTAGSILLVIAYLDDDPLFMEQIADHLVRTFQYYKKNDNRLNNYGKTFKELLSRELLLESDENAERLLRQSSSTGYLAKPPYRILCFSARDGSSDLLSASSCFSAYFPSSYVMVFDGILAAFLYDSEVISGCQTAGRHSLEQFCQRFQLVCCISSEFSELSERQAFLLQAKSLLPVCVHLYPESILFYADEYYCEYMLMQAGMHMEPGTMFLTAITYLEKADRENGTEYLETLACYLHNQMNAAAAARELFIDRTTLKYRLRKIDETIHVKIEEPRTAFAIRLALLYRKIDPYLQAERQES